MPPVLRQGAPNITSRRPKHQTIRPTFLKRDCAPGRYSAGSDCRSGDIRGVGLEVASRGTVDTTSGIGTP